MLRCFLWLLLFAVPWLSASATRYVFVSAPNVIRVGNTETVLVSLLGQPGTAAVEVTVTLKNGDQRDICPPQSVMVDPDNPQIVEMFIDGANIPPIESPEDVKLYAKLGVSCNDLCGNIPAKDLLISYEEGFVFIQTDKPIYTPDQAVNIRLLILDQNLRPSTQQVDMDIRTPQNVTVTRKEEIVARNNGFWTYSFRFPQEPLFGNWSVVVRYGAEMKANRSVQFEVKEYILPTFSVKLRPPDYILPSDQDITVEVSAKYVFGKPVIGTFFAKVGVLDSDGDIEIVHRKIGDLQANGIGHFSVGTAEFGPNCFEQNCRGNRLYLEVSVLETATGISENVSDASVVFVDTPYIFRWDRALRYFKKGLPYTVMVDLVFANRKPATEVPVLLYAICNTDRGEKRIDTGDEQNPVEQNLQTSREKGLLNFRLYPSLDCNSILISLTTDDEGLKSDETDYNAQSNFTVDPYESPANDEFLMINIDERHRSVPIDASLDLEVNIERPAGNLNVPYLGYYVVSKGKISQANSQEIRNTQIQGFRIHVTYDMAPTARVVAFYVSPNNHVIADSIWIHITRRCENHLELGIAHPATNNVQEPADEYKPDRNILLGVTGKPQTTVSVLAVDKAVYLLRDYHRLTSDKMYNTMDLYDTGCGPGDGRNSSDIFKNAGVMVLSNAELDVNRREVYGCATLQNRRRRRSVENPLLQEQLETYTDGDESFACRRGHRRLGAGLTCEDRAQRFMMLPRVQRHDNSQLLQEIFKNCCRLAESVEDSPVTDSEGRSRSGGNVADADLIEDIAEPAQIRSDFKETWILEEIEIGPNGLGHQAFTIPSSITEWSVTAVGLSDEYPMCVAEPLDILVRQDVFIQLHMPYSVVRKEQVEILVTVFNYQKIPMRFDVYMRTPEEICTSGRRHKWSNKREITVGSESATSVRYVLIGMAVGEHPVEVAVYPSGLNNSIDAVKKTLRVVPEGIETIVEFSSTLDPAESMRDQAEVDVQPRTVAGFDFITDVGRGVQVDHFNFSLPSTVVPNTEKCELSIVGTVLGPVVTTMIEGLESLLRVPGGCGEQTMIGLTPNVYIIRYLNSLEAATDDLVAKAVSNINRGIMNEQRFRKDDGSFAVFTSEPISSTWLTAFVNKVFCHASDIDGVHVDNSHITCMATEWLINSAQRDDGAFQENGRVIHREMTGGVQGDATLTAFVLISILECECASLNATIAASRARATAFLEGQIDSIRRPYAMAIVTYALALAGSSEVQHANTMLKSMSDLDENGLRYWGADGSSLQDNTKPYWYRHRPSAITVETTGYALLAQLALGDITYSHAIVKWLSSQQNYGGGFAATQDTTIALQALSEYSINAHHDNIDMTCSFEEHGELKSFMFNEENAVVQQHGMPPVRGPFNVTTVGTGTGKLNVKLTFNTISTNVDETPCAFRILINEPESAEDEAPRAALPEQPPAAGRGHDGRSRIGKRQAEQDPADDEHAKLDISVEVAYRSDEPTNMAIIDVGIPSGYKAKKEDLERILEEDGHFISRFEPSQRSVIFYANYIPTVESGEKLRLAFQILREFKVGNLSPVAVRVYDYYNTTAECKKFYHPSSDEATASELANVCEGDLCVCAAGDCFDCGPNSKEVLLERSCRSGQTYAYRIQITRKRQEVGFTVFEAVILEEIKAADDTIRLGDEREFWISKSCPECAIRLRKNSQHLVIGETVLEYVTKEKMRSYKYILDETASVEFWPRDNPKAKYVAQLEKMNQFKLAMERGQSNCQ